ncbi:MULTISPECIES: hypothetical protein [unclassified Gilliamella]|uniref:hypothetical protein n=1 Tax=unclassified Gilliamella TaxID=2685620 RepID=UPI00226AC019|nr:MULTISPECIES: hypothetical protein [unclassified Gilliamella]MCX8588529.1 hypothetical protein [Gilliamella sp. B3801]MCX8592967.1 hypothetical protein [Gilliamella sp. B3804]
MTAALTKNLIKYMNRIQEVVKTRLFLENWKEAIDNIGFAFFDNGTSLEEALLPIDLKPNLNVINQLAQCLSCDDRLFLNVLLYFYDATLVSKHTIIQLSTLDERRKRLLMHLVENYLPTHFEEVKQ